MAEKQVIKDIHHIGDEKFLITTNELGKERLLLYDLKGPRKETIFKNGKRNKFQKPYLNYPVYIEHQRAGDFSILYEKRDIIQLYRFTENASERFILPENIQVVYSGLYLENNKYIFSANVEGQSDIIEYDLRGRSTRQITHDVYDELYITNACGRDSIIYLSNRQNTTDSIFPGLYTRPYSVVYGKDTNNLITTNKHYLKQLKNNKCNQYILSKGLGIIKSSNNKTSLVLNEPLMTSYEVFNDSLVLFSIACDEKKLSANIEHIR